MKREVLVNAVETHIAEANGDVSVGLKNFHRQMDDVIENQGITLEHVSLRNLFEATADRGRTVNMNSSTEIAEASFAAGMPNLTGKLLHPVFMNTYKPLTDNVMQLVMEVPSSRSKETIGGLSAHDEPQMVREGAPYPESQPYEKYATISNHKFGITISLTAEAIREDQTGNIVGKAKEIAIKGGTQIHAFIIQKVCDLTCSVTGEPYNYSLIIDGTARAKFADTHATWDNGQTNDNLGSTALSADGLTAAKLLLSKMVDEKGTPILIMPRFLIVPSALEVAAQVLMQSAGKPGTANNDVNVYKGAYTIVSSPFIDADATYGGATCYFLGDPTLQSRIQWYDKPTTETLGGNTQIAFTNDIISQHKFKYHAGVGCTDYRYLVKGNA